MSDGYGNSRVVKFSSTGKFLLEWGRKGSGPGEFDTPHGLALGPQGKLYVADRGNARVQVFDQDGVFLAQWSSAKLGRPWGLTIGKDGFAYVVDGGDQVPGVERSRVLKLDLDGKVVAAWGSYGKYDGQFVWPHDVEVDAEGNVYVVDVHFGMRIQKFVAKR